MAYSSEIASLLTVQLEKFATLKRHQLAVHIPNLDFWLAEVAHALAVIDGYETRLERMRGEHDLYVLEHGEPESRRSASELGVPPSGPKHVPPAELGGARRALCQAAHRFVTRCLDEQFITHAEFDAAQKRLGIDPADLHRS